MSQKNGLFLVFKRHREARARADAAARGRSHAHEKLRNWVGIRQGIEFWPLEFGYGVSGTFDGDRADARVVIVTESKRWTSEAAADSMEEALHAALASYDALPETVAPPFPLDDDTVERVA